jgi:hypothetical protein
MAGVTLALAKEKVFTCRAIAGNVGFGGRRIQRENQCCKSIERIVWEIEGWHSGSRNPGPDQVAQS